MNKKYLIVVGVIILAVITVFVFNFPVEKSDANGLSNVKKNNEQLSEIINTIENEIKKNDVVSRIKSNNKDLVIIETSIGGSDMGNAIKNADKIMSKIQGINKLSAYKSFAVQIDSADGKILSYTQFLNKD